MNQDEVKISVEFGCGVSVCLHNFLHTVFHSLLSNRMLFVFHSISGLENLENWENGGLVIRVSPHALEVFSGYSSFLHQSKDMYCRLRGSLNYP